MRAMARYIIMKGVREHFIATLVAAPPAMFVTPLVMLAVYSLLRGREAWPFRLASNVSPLQSAQVLGGAIIMLGAVIAATAAFWVFRTEMSGRTIAFFLLAKSPLTGPLTTTLFGAVIGAGSCFLTLLMLAVLTQSPLTTFTAKLGDAILLIVLGSAAGTFSVGISSATNTLLPAYALICFGALGLEQAEARYDWVPLAIAAALTLTAPILWRRRCVA